MANPIINAYSDGRMATETFKAQSALGGLISPLDGMPFEFAERSFNRKVMGITIGNGYYTGPAAAGAAGGWTDTSNGAAGTVALDNAGSLVLTSSTTDESNENLQYLQLPFRYSATKKFWVFGRFAVSTAATTDFYFGLFESQTAIVAASAIAATDDSIGFFKAATATDLTGRVAKAGTATTVAMGLTLTNAAYFVCGFVIDKGVIRLYAALDPNDAILSSPALLGAGKAIANTNAPNTVDTFLSLVCGQEGGTTARTLTVPWAFACAEHA